MTAGYTGARAGRAAAAELRSGEASKVPQGRNGSGSGARPASPADPARLAGSPPGPYPPMPLIEADGDIEGDLDGDIEGEADIPLMDGDADGICMSIGAPPMPMLW